MKNTASNAKQQAIKDLLDYIAGRRWKWFDSKTGCYKMSDKHKTEIKRLVDSI